MTTTTRATLVSSSDVNGTEVYSPDGTNVGTIDHLMIDKQSGKVAYAVMAFGGFLGIGEDHRPVPWGKLNYDTNKGGFVSDITPEEVQSAPDRTNDWYADRAWDQRTHDHYQVPGACRRSFTSSQRPALRSEFSTTSSISALPEARPWMRGP